MATSTSTSTTLLDSVSSSVRTSISQSRSSLDSWGRSMSIYFGSNKNRMSVLADASNSVKPRWLSNRKSTFASLDGLQDLDVSECSLDDDLAEAEQEGDEQAEQAETEQTPGNNGVGAFVNERVTTFWWNIECIAGNIADTFTGSTTGTSSTASTDTGAANKQGNPQESSEQFEFTKE